MCAYVRLSVSVSVSVFVIVYVSVSLCNTPGTVKQSLQKEEFEGTKKFQK